MGAIKTKTKSKLKTKEKKNLNKPKEIVTILDVMVELILSLVLFCKDEHLTELTIGEELSSPPIFSGLLGVEECRAYIFLINIIFRKLYMSLVLIVTAVCLLHRGQGFPAASCADLRSGACGSY